MIRSSVSAVLVMLSSEGIGLREICSNAFQVRQGSPIKLVWLAGVFYNAYRGIQENYDY